MTCPLCGEPKRDMVSRGPLVAKAEPLEVFWHGRKVHLTPTQAKLLWPLIRFGRVANSVLDFCLGESVQPNTLYVHICNIRRAFRQQGVGASIPTIRGWGFELQVQP